MKTKDYVIASSSIFGVVTLIHAIRYMRGWPVQIGSLNVPVKTSLPAILVGTALMVWGFSLVGRE